MNDRRGFERGERLATVTLFTLLAMAAVPGAATAQVSAGDDASGYADPVARSCPPIQSGAVAHHGIETVVRYLSDDALEGRFSGSVGERCAGDFIAGEFARLGLHAAGEDGYYQEVPLASAANPHAPAGTGRNVLGLLPGTDPELRDELVIVGAHYDHLGRGTFGSLSDEEAGGAVHNGADDNASGVAALLEAAAQLTAGSPPSRSILFMAFTGEELGLLGSGHYVKNPTRPMERTVAMLNLDMVGRLGDEPLIVYGIGTAKDWKEIVERANENRGIELGFQDAGYGPSDQTSFYAADIPVLHFFTNVHGDYHKPSDDWEKLDLDGIHRVAGLVADVAGRVAGRPDRLAVISGVGSRDQRSDGYGSYLGTIPDFSPVEHGVLLSGVSGGSPAEAAGIRKGDIVIGIGEFEIADLYDLTEALRAQRPGDRVDVRILRAGAEKRFEIVLGSRSERN